VGDPANSHELDGRPPSARCPQWSASHHRHATTDLDIARDVRPRSPYGGPTRAQFPRETDTGFMSRTMAEAAGGWFPAAGVGSTSLPGFAAVPIVAAIRACENELPA